MERGAETQTEKTDERKKLRQEEWRHSNQNRLKKLVTEKILEEAEKDRMKSKRSVVGSDVYE